MLKRKTRFSYVGKRPLDEAFTVCDIASPLSLTAEHLRWGAVAQAEKYVGGKYYTPQTIRRFVRALLLKIDDA